MDSKAWPWKKKTAEKTILETDKAKNLTSKGNGEEIEKLLDDKIELEQHLKKLNDKFSSTLAECNAKDDLVKKHESEAREALAGWEKAKAEAVSLKRKLDEALNEKNTSEEGLSHLDAHLRECMQQVHFVREEQEQRMHDALTKTSKEYDKKLVSLEEKLADTGKKLAEADGESSRLSKALLATNKIIEDMKRERNQVEADFSALVSRLETKEKENASLRYEVRVLERELEIRNEEREFNRRTAEASHKLHLENVKKIAKLEAECQRLRLLIRKRLPGPAALTKMKNEVEMFGRDSLEMRRRFNTSPNGKMINSERINNLTEQLCLMEEENRTLREALNRKLNELQFSRNMYSRTASRLLEFESHLDESSKAQTNTERSRVSNVSHEVSLASVSDIDIDDKISSSDSWASALLSELENFKNKKQKGSSLLMTPEASVMNLMDDFAEMEKLAVVSVDNPPGVSPVCSPDFYGTKGNSLEVVLKGIWEHMRVTQRNADEILEDIRKALSSINNSSSISKNPASESSILEDTPRGETGKDTSFPAKCNQSWQDDVSISIRKIIDLIEGVSLDSPANNVPGISPSKDERRLLHRTSGTQSGYTVRVLQWKTSELSDVLQRFLHSCYDLLDKKADVKKFAEDLSSALDWIVNHCFSLQDVSSMREEIKKQLDWDESQSESEAEIRILGQVSEEDKSNPPKDYLGSSSVSDKGGIMADQLQDSDKSIINLQKELKSLRKSVGDTEDKAKNHKLSSENVEETGYLKLQQESASVSEKKTPIQEDKPDQKQPLRTEREITAASEKLAECQETILNLGKQLKAFSNPKEAATLSDNVMSEPAQTSNNSVTTPASKAKWEKRLTSQRSSLLEQMKADDDAEESKDQKPQEDKKGKNSTFVYNETIEALEHILLSETSRVGEANSFAVVPQKKHGGVKSLWKKLLWRKKKGNSKKLPVPFAS